VLQQKSDQITNFDLLINCDFFWPNNLGFPHGMSAKFGLRTFHKLQKLQTNFDFIDFWLPYWSCLCYCQYKPADDSRDPCGRRGTRGHRVGDPWPKITTQTLTTKKLTHQQHGSQNAVCCESVVFYKIKIQSSGLLALYFSAKDRPALACVQSVSNFPQYT